MSRNYWTTDGFDEDEQRLLTRMDRENQLLNALIAARPFVYAETKVKALYGKEYKDASDALSLIDSALAIARPTQEIKT